MHTGLEWETVYPTVEQICVMFLELGQENHFQ